MPLAHKHDVSLTPSRREVDGLVQKVIDVVGASPRSFADAAKNAVSTAAKTVRGLKWARVSDLEMELDGKTVKSYRTTVRIYFDVEG